MIDNLLNSLEKVKRTGHNKWIARCPCHNDKTPSLSITDTDNTILLYCFGCGANGAQVCETLGIDINELFPNSDIDYRFYPQRKSSIPADQALYALQQECTVIYMIAKDMLTSRNVDQPTCDRLLQACERVHAVTVSYRD